MLALFLALLRLLLLLLLLLLLPILHCFACAHANDGKTAMLTLCCYDVFSSRGQLAHYLAICDYLHYASKYLLLPMWLRLGHWRLILPLLAYHTAWYLVLYGISCCLVSCVSWHIVYRTVWSPVPADFLVSRMSWYLVLRCILYCLVSPASWCVLLPSISCWLGSLTFQYVVHPDISYCLVSRTA